MKKINLLLILTTLLMSTRAFAQPNPPATVIATDGAFSDKILVVWSSVSDVTGYDDYRSVSNNSSTASKIASTSSSLLEMDDVDVSAGITYYYWVKSKIIAGGTVTQSAFSSSDDGWLEGTTSIYNVFENNNISIYPNPTQNNFHIKSSSDFNCEIIISLYDCLGNLILSNKLDHLSTYNSYVIDASNLKCGLYFLQMKYQEKIKIEKIIKQ